MNFNAGLKISLNMSKTVEGDSGRRKKLVFYSHTLFLGVFNSNVRNLFDLFNGINQETMCWLQIANVFLNTTFVFLVKILQLPGNCSRSRQWKQLILQQLLYLTLDCLNSGRRKLIWKGQKRKGRYGLEFPFINRVEKKENYSQRPDFVIIDIVQGKVW